MHPWPCLSGRKHDRKHGRTGTDRTETPHRVRTSVTSRLNRAGRMHLRLLAMACHSRAQAIDRRAQLCQTRLDHRDEMVHVNNHVGPTRESSNVRQRLLRAARTRHRRETRRRSVQRVGVIRTRIRIREKIAIRMTTGEVATSSNESVAESFDSLRLRSIEVAQRPQPTIPVTALVKGSYCNRCS